MKKAEDLMNTQPDSSLTLLNSIERGNLKSDLQQAEFGLLSLEQISGTETANQLQQHRNSQISGWPGGGIG